MHKTWRGEVYLPHQSKISFLTLRKIWLSLSPDLYFVLENVQNYVQKNKLNLTLPDFEYQVKDPWIMWLFIDSGTQQQFKTGNQKLLDNWQRMAEEIQPALKGG